MNSTLKARGAAVLVAGLALAGLAGGAAPSAHAAVPTSKAAVARLGCDAGTHHVAINRFGYLGYLKCGSAVWWADYQRDGKVDEFFGVAPNGDVYHVWPGSNGWQRLGNGNVDDLSGVYFRDFNHRTVYGVKSGHTWVTAYDYCNYRSNYCSSTGPRWFGWYAL